MSEQSSENEAAGEKTEQPTARRLQQAREQGNGPRSRELATAAVFSAGVLAVGALSGPLGHGTLHWMRAALSPDKKLFSQADLLANHFAHLLLRLFQVISPLLLVCMLACFLAPLLMGGLHFSTQGLSPNLNRLNPISGWKRLYGSHALAELLRSLLRTVLLGTAAALCLWQGQNNLRALLRFPLETAIGSGLALTLRLLLACALALVLLAAIDVPWQRFIFRRKLMMSRDELRRELKESEGSPEMRARIRQLQMQLAQRRMIEAIPSADVVIVNPQHYAVALKYEGQRMNAPVLVARGVDEMALRIRQVAQSHQVSIVSAPPLARALYREGQLGKEIPVRLYAAVAQVLSWVYQVRHWRAGPLPPLPVIHVEEEHTP